jgi:hypothetical protein
MRRLLATVVFTAFAATQMGCYTTRVAGGIAPAASEPIHEERQWFTIAGLIGLSGPAGNECRNGVAWAESQYNVVDALLVGVLSVGGYFAAGYACASGDPTTFNACASAGAWLLPLLLQPRTVRYTCLNTGAAASNDGTLPLLPDAQSIAAK